MNNAERVIRETLEEKGYRSDYSYKGIGRRYTGKENIAGEEIEVAILVQDFNFAIRPKFYLMNPNQKIKEFIPHLDVLGEFCYAASDTLVLDRYNRGGAILLARKKFREELALSLSGKNSEDVLHEFSSYWLGLPIRYDLREDFSGMAQLRELDEHSYLGPIITNKLDSSAPVYIFNYDNDAPLYAYNREAKDLSNILDWCENICSGSRQLILDKLADHGQSFPIIMMNGKYGMFGFSIDCHLALKTITWPKPLRIGLINYCPNIKIQKYTGENISDNFVYKRSLIRRATLENKKICIIGCGTIGSHLAKFAAQSGAGSGDDGELYLIDKQKHEASNIGRHILGHDYLDKNKAEALKEYIQSIYPNKNIRISKEEATTLFTRIQKYDLIVDATGDTVFSRSLNGYKFECENSKTFPDVLFVWLKGLGAACQAFLVIGNKKACYQCLEASFNEHSRYEPLKNPKADIFQSAKCGDGIYIPYSVASAATAAGLALEMMLDWSKGDPRKLLRTRLIESDPEITKYVKDRSPDKFKRCPLCFPNT